MTVKIQTRGEYRQGNPKIDIYDTSGRYLHSTNWWRTCRDALAHFKRAMPNMKPNKARIDRRSR